MTQRGKDASDHSGGDWSLRTTFLLLAGTLALSAVVLFPGVLTGTQVFVFRDVSSFYYPQALYTARTLAEANLPLWHPGIGLGFPFHADPHSGLFYPLSLILLVVPFPLAYNLFTLIHYPIAGAGIFVLARQIGLQRRAAMASVLVYTCSGYAVTLACLVSQLHPLAWAPWALWSFGRLLQSASGRDLATTSLFLYLQGVCGDPMILLITGASMLLWRWVLPSQTPAPWLRVLPGLTLAACLSGLLLAVQFLPLAELTVHSSRAGGTGAANREFYHLRPANAWELLLPLPIQDPGSPLFLGNFDRAVLPMFYNIYFGLLASTMALMACLCGGRRERLLAGGSLLFLLLALGPAAGVEKVLTTLLPFLGLLRFPGKYLFGFNLLISLLVASCLDRASRRREDSLKLGLTSASIAGATLLVFLVLLPSLKPLLTGWLASAVPPGSWRSELVGVLAQAHMSNLLFSIVLLLTVTLFTAGPIARRITPGRTATVLLAFLAFDLLAASRNTQPMAPASFYTSPPRALALLPSPEAWQTRILSELPEVTRIGGERSVLHVLRMSRDVMENLMATNFGHGAAGGPGAIVLQVEEKVNRIARSLPTTQADRLRSNLGVTHVVTGVPTTSPLRKLHSPPGDLPAVYELTQSVPSAFIATRAVALNRPIELDADRLLRLPGGIEFEDLEAGGPTVLAPEAVTRCEIVDRGPNHVMVEVDLKGTGLLVLRENDYPGWSVDVDGVRRPLLRAAGLFRAVVVREGDRSVAFTYRPTSLTLGALLSLLGLMVCAFLFRTSVRL